MSLNTLKCSLSTIWDSTMGSAIACQAVHLHSFSLVNRAHSTYGNIMYDRRVIRGNTYAQRFLSTVGREIILGLNYKQSFR